MSVHVCSDSGVPADTVRVAQAVFPKGNPYLTLREELGGLYADTLFAPLFAARGRPAEAPGRLAVVLVLQFAEGLSDRQAAEAVRSRIDWKYLLGLELTDAGFDFSVLSLFRARLVAGGVAQRVLDTVLERFKARGLLKARGQQRTDSTHVLAAIRTVNRLECVGETLRHALNALAAEAPEWVQAQVPLAWYPRYAARFEAYRLPKTETARQALAETIGRDGEQLLQWAYTPETPAEVRTHPAVEILRQVWVQQYAPQAGEVQWRTADNLPPAEQLIQSPYDPQARYSRKRETRWTGYKVHLTESCDAAAPRLLTHVTTTAATTPDAAVTETIHHALAAKALLPAQHLVDAGYVDAAVVVNSQRQYGIAVVGPVAPDTSWQAQAGQGFDSAHFSIDWTQHHVTCPQGQPSQVWSESQDVYGNPVIHVRFAPAACQACPARARCTHAAQGPRALKLQPQAQHEVLQQARQRQTTPEFKDHYALRAGVEGTLSQGTRGCGLRRTRYLGQAKTHLQHLLTAVALNLVRFVAWVQRVPLAPTRTSAFAALART
jgi:transposase